MKLKKEATMPRARGIETFSVESVQIARELVKSSSSEPAARKRLGEQLIEEAHEAVRRPVKPVHESTGKR